MTAGARTTDPDTSQMAAQRNGSDDLAQREALLVAWFKAGDDGLSDPEAAERAGLLHRTHWKRAGEMREPHRGPRNWQALTAGQPLLAWHPDGETRIHAATGGRRKVSVITEAGRAYALAHGLVEQPVIVTGDEVAALPAGAAVVADSMGATSAGLHLGAGVLAMINDRGDAVRRQASGADVYRVLWRP
jgi:hypothetical protein